MLYLSKADCSLDLGSKGKSTTAGKTRRFLVETSRAAVEKTDSKLTFIPTQIASQQTSQHKAEGGCHRSHLLGAE